MRIETITPRELAAKHGDGLPVDLLDVRSPIEFREIHSSLARNVPLSGLDAKSVVSSRDTSNNQPIYVICRSGGRGQQACEKFHAIGFTNVVNVEGGTLAWVEAGLPVNRGPKVMSLERQVRIAAGTLVLLGISLAFFVHPYLIGLSAFVGAGLIVAGITDTCGMGMILAKIPWNRLKSSTNDSSSVIPPNR
jgi:rhodanese-related sulfurtransferase